MKIVSQDPSRLVAKDNGIGAIIFGAFFVIVGLAVSGLALSSHQPKGLVALLFSAIGVFAILTAKTRTLDIDKGAGQLTFTVKTLLSSKTVPYPMSGVAKVQLMTSYSETMEGGAGPGRGETMQTQQHTRLLIVMTDGSTIDTADGQRSMNVMNVFSSVPNMGVGQQIASFIGVPFEQIGPMGLGQAVGAVTGMLRGNMNANATNPSVVPQAPAQPTMPPAATPPEMPASPPEEQPPAGQPPTQ